MLGRIRQSICFGPFARELGVEKLIETAVSLGFASIEMAPEEHWPAIKAAGLEIAIVSGHKSLQDGLNRRENHDRIDRELTESIRKAEANGIRSLITFSGNRNGLDDDEGIEICAEGLRRVIKRAEDAGVVLCLELLNSKVNHPDYQADSTQWGVKVCQAVDSPNCKLLYDIYHMQIMEGDLIRTIRESIDYIGHFHTAGNPGRNDLDDEQEINYRAVMRAIAATGYDGYVGHEFKPKGDPVAALRQAFEVCDVG